MSFLTGILLSRVQVVNGFKFDLSRIGCLRRFGTTSNKNSISNPFQPKKEKSNQDVNEFIKDFKASSKEKNLDIKLKDDNLLGRLIKNIFNPTPLNIRFREKYSLNENYRLVYLIENERMFLIAHNIINLLAPVFFIIVGIFFVSELTGRSQMSKSFEDPYLFVSFLTVWFSFAYFMAKRVQSATIFRIYYNSKENKFVSIKQKGFFNFEKEEFTKENVKLRFNQNSANKNQLIQNLTKNFGNVYINNRLRQIDFKLFSSDDIVEKIAGKENLDLLKQTKSKFFK